MKKLSESLADLQTKVSEMQQSAEASRKESQEKLEERWHRTQDALAAQGKAFDASVHNADDSVREWSLATRGAVDRRFQEVREDVARWRAERNADSAERAAEVAEQHATAASNIARYTLEQAESASVQAALARAEARKLSKKSQDAPAGVG